MGKLNKPDSVFRNKRIKKLDTSSINQWTFHFDDGSSATIDAGTMYVAGGTLPTLELSSVGHPQLYTQTGSGKSTRRRS